MAEIKKPAGVRAVVVAREEGRLIARVYKLRTGAARMGQRLSKTHKDSMHGGQDRASSCSHTNALSRRLRERPALGGLSKLMRGMLVAERTALVGVN